MNMLYLHANFGLSVRSFLSVDLSPSVTLGLEREYQIDVHSLYYVVAICWSNLMQFVTFLEDEMAYQCTNCGIM